MKLASDHPLLCLLLAAGKSSLASASFLLLPIAALGAVIGSFLNVVIYRLPRGLSLLSPRWSFCPNCRQTIRPTDNVPILGWLRLMGRCRACAMPIESIYPVIEGLTVLVFITVWDILFTSRLIPAITDLSLDWPLAIAYLGLFAGLLASSAMDVESYTIDIRISVVVMIVAVLAHALRGIPAEALIPPVDRPLGLLPPGLCLVAAAAGATWFVGWVFMALFRGSRKTTDPIDRESTPSPPGEVENSNDNASASPAVATRFQPMPIVLFVFAIVGLLLWQLLAPAQPHGYSIPPVGLRCLAAFSICMFILILASWVHRPADTEIVDEIEQSRHRARRVAFLEWAAFLPAIAVGMAVFFWLRGAERWSFKSDWPDVQRLCGDAWPWARFLAGGLQAIGAMVFGSAMGWTVRILGTLAFGKEAFGTGDIYLMGAIAAAAGVPNLVFGFFLSALLALIGVAATVLRKSSRAIPFGPWLALGSFVALALEGFLLGFFKHATALLWSLISGVPSWEMGG